MSDETNWQRYGWGVATIGETFAYACWARNKYAEHFSGLDKPTRTTFFGAWRWDKGRNR